MDKNPSYSHGNSRVRNRDMKVNHVAKRNGSLTYLSKAGRKGGRCREAASREWEKGSAARLTLASRLKSGGRSMVGGIRFSSPFPPSPPPNLSISRLGGACADKLWERWGLGVWLVFWW